MEVGPNGLIGRRALGVVELESQKEYAYVIIPSM